MSHQDRIQLALAACEGLSNEELAQRGAGGFKAMIQRKRLYAQAARELHAAAVLAATKMMLAHGEVEKAKARSAKAMATMAAMDAELPEDFTTNVSSMLGAIFTPPAKKGSDEN
jgi:hypothetical protein